MKVVRIQHVLDVRSDSMFTSQSTEELGCGKLFSHAKGLWFITLVHADDLEQRVLVAVLVL